MTIKVIGKGAKAGGGSFEYSPGFVFTSDLACRDYDWLVVYDELSDDERLCCPRERTILATWEPVSIKCYSGAYVRQFGHLLTNRPPEAEKHPHYHLGRGYYRWFCDRTYPEVVTTVLPAKSKAISVVCSSKRMRRTKHFARYRLVSEIKRAIPELEWYGHGVLPFGKKYEVMDPFRYHVVIENHIAPHHWTEKLSDAFLCECLPFYARAPDLADDFPKESFIPIPIDDPNETIRIVKAAIAADEYGKRREAVLEAKRLILTKYNFWAQVIDVIEASRGQTCAPVSGYVDILPRRRLRRNPIVALGDALAHLRMSLGRF